MIKGYEFVKGQYVIFIDEEIKLLMEKVLLVIEILEFVLFFEVELIYYDKVYFFGLEIGGECVY